jgi:hypothetical protein
MFEATDCGTAFFILVEILGTSSVNVMATKHEIEAMTMLVPNVHLNMGLLLDMASFVFHDAFRWVGRPD